MLASLSVRHYFIVCWQCRHAAALPADAAGDGLQGPKREVQLGRKALSSKENQRGLPAAGACQPSEQHMANASQSSKPNLSRGEPLPLLISGRLRSVDPMRSVASRLRTRVGPSKPIAAVCTGTCDLSGLDDDAGTSSGNAAVPSSKASCIGSSGAAPRYITGLRRNGFVPPLKTVKPQSADGNNA